MFPAFFSNKEPRKSITLKAWNNLTLELAFPEDTTTSQEIKSVYLYVEVMQQKYPRVHLSTLSQTVDAADPANDIYGPTVTLYTNNSSNDVSIDLVTEADTSADYSFQVNLEEDYIVPTPLNSGLTKAHKKIVFGRFGEQFEIERDNHLSVVEIKHWPDQLTGTVRLEFFHSDEKKELSLSKDKNIINLATEVSNYQDIHLLTIESDGTQPLKDNREMVLHFAYEK